MMSKSLYLGGLVTPLLNPLQHPLVVLVLGRELLRPRVPAQSLAALDEPAAMEAAPASAFGKKERKKRREKKEEEKRKEKEEEERAIRSHELV